MTNQTAQTDRMVSILKVLILGPVYVGVLFLGTLVSEARKLLRWVATTVGSRVGHQETPDPVTHDQQSR